MKVRRHNTILRLVEDHLVTSQDQLQGLLSQEGISVNQATLSRDLRAPRVLKRPIPAGGSRYQPASTGPDPAVAVGNLRAFMRQIIPSGNLLVVRTRIGGAQPVGLALDQLCPAGVIGTLAGDDTVLVVLSEGADAHETIDNLWSILEDKGEST